MALTEVYTDVGLSDPFLQWKIIRDRHFKWCKENCTGYYSCDMLQLATRWSFTDETEAMAFKLMWC